MVKLVKQPDLYFRGPWFKSLSCQSLFLTSRNIKCCAIPLNWQVKELTVIIKGRDHLSGWNVMVRPIQIPALDSSVGNVPNKKLKRATFKSWSGLSFFLHPNTHFYNSTNCHVLYLFRIVWIDFCSYIQLSFYDSVKIFCFNKQYLKIFCFNNLMQELNQKIL